jgi:hypothetical protein
MSDIQVILQNSILYTAGAEGLARFNKAVGLDDVSGIVGTDGSLDLSRLMNMLLDVFREEQASSIMDNTLARYMEIANEEQAKEYAILDANVSELQAVAGEGSFVQDDTRQESAPADGASAQESRVSDQEYKESDLAEYFSTDASEVRDLINEARRIRIAMGKPAPKISRVPSFGKPINAAEESHRPPPIDTIRKASQSVSLNNELLDQEIEDYISKSSLVSIDVMDVMRYLKEKGYYFQENTVLEKVYSKIEERKNKVRDWILHDIQLFLADKSWPNESDVSSYIKHVRDVGIVYDEAEIRRMILIEMIRKA